MMEPRIVNNFARKISLEASSFIMRQEMNEEQANELMNEINDQITDILSDKGYWE